MKRWILIVSVLLAAVACKKSEIVPPDTEDPTPQPSKNENELIADSVFYSPRKFTIGRIKSVP